jgi:hypothetical protein
MITRIVEILYALVKENIPIRKEVAEEVQLKESVLLFPFVVAGDSIDRPSQ